MKPIFAAYPQQRAKFTWGKSLVEADLHTWDAPDNTSLLISAGFRCPSCQYPIHVKASAQTCEIMEGLLTVRHQVKCPAHWAKTDSYGNFEINLNGNLEREHCGWSAVISKGEAHAQTCTKLQGNKCTCVQREGSYEQIA